MRRWILGAFGPGGLGASRLAKALEPLEANTLESGALRLAYSGPPAHSLRPLCLLDGIIDNAAELRAELGLTGAVEEEELLATGYRQLGAELPARLRGDFAVLLWDPERGEGLLARDQLGVQPMYIHESDGGVLFAGETRHLTAAMPRRPEPDRASLAHWIATSNRPGMQTLWTGVRRLHPGGALRFGPKEASERLYWEPTFEEPLELPSDRLAAEVREGLERSVLRRLGGPGVTGVLMSGGLDSSAVAALCAQSDAGEVYACSGTFPDHPEADESKLIAELRAALGLPGPVLEARPGGLLASALEHLDAWQMPLLGWGDFWMLKLMRAAASEGVGTLLDGDGGDELFGPRSHVLADRLRGGHLLDARRLARELPGGGPHVPCRKVAGMLWEVGVKGALPFTPHDLRRGATVRRSAPSWLRPETLADLVASDDPFAWKRLEGPRWWAHAAHGITRGIEEAGVFEHQRRRAALAGLQARHPLLDLDLVSLALRQPPRATLDHRFSRPVLRESMAGLLPDSVRLRPAKARFEGLIADSLDGPDGTAVKEILTAPDLELAAYVDPRQMRRALFDSDELRRENRFRWMWQVWRLLTAELWLRSLASRPNPAIAPSTTFFPLERRRRFSRLIPRP